MTFGDRLKKLRKKKGLTLDDLSNEFDRGKTAFSNYENNHRKPNMNLVNELADFFEVSVDYLLGREDLEKEEAKIFELIPIVDISMGQAILKTDNIIGYKKVPRDTVEGGEYFYLRMNGDNSMINAGIQNRDLVLIRKQVVVDNGDISLIVFEDKVSLRYFYSTEHQYILQTANPIYKPDVVDHGEVEIIGKAVEIIRRL